MSDELYKGFVIFAGNPEGDAGQALNDNFKLTADHLDDTNNPHQTTAAQLGVYTEEQIDTLLLDKADAAHTHPYLSAVVEDTSPQLGGHLNANNRNISSVATLNGTTLTGVLVSGTTLTGTTVNGSNLRLQGNTLSSTNTNGQIQIIPNGNGAIASRMNLSLGDSAIDLQRGGVTLQRAAGAYAFAVGTNNTVSGNHGVGFGFSNLITGRWAVGLGHSQYASADHAYVFGVGNVVDSLHGVAQGYYCQTRAYAAQAAGHGAIARYPGQHVQAGDAPWGYGVTQTSVLVLHGETIDIATDNLRVAGETGLKIPYNQSCAFIVHVLGQRQDAPNHVLTRIEGVISNIAGFGSLTRIVTNLVNQSGDSVTIDAHEVSSEGDVWLHITCQGASSSSYYWVARVELIDIINSTDSGGYEYY